MSKLERMYPTVEKIVVIRLSWKERLKTLFLGRVELLLTFGQYEPPELSLAPYMKVDGPRGPDNPDYPGEPGI